MSADGMSYTEPLPARPGERARRRWHYGHEPGWACNDRCTTIVHSPPARTVSGPQLRAMRTRLAVAASARLAGPCTMCKLDEDHRAFQSEIVQEGRTAGMCGWCAEKWEAVDWPRANVVLDAHQDRRDRRRTVLAGLAALAAVALVLWAPLGQWFIWSLITIAAVTSWAQLVQLNASRAAARARENRRRAERSGR